MMHPKTPAPRKAGARLNNAQRGGSNRPRRLGLGGAVAAAVLLSVAALFPAPALANDCDDPHLAKMQAAAFAASLETVADRLDQGGFGRSLAEALRVEHLEPGAAIRTQALELEALAAFADVEASSLLCGAFDQNPLLLDAPGQLDQLLQSVDTQVRSGSCADPEVAESILSTVEGLRLAGTIAQAICDGQSCPPYVGAIVCAPAFPSCSIACPLAAAAEVIASTAEFVFSQIERCQQRQHYNRTAEGHAQLKARADQIHEALSAPLLNVNEELSTRAAADALEQVADDLDGSLEALDERLDSISEQLDSAALAAAEELSLLDAIQLELLIQDDAGPTVELALPRAVGGRLEDVRAASAAAISMVAQLGEDTKAAVALFDAGDGAFNSAMYADAFNNYRDAYRQVAGAPKK